MVLISTPACSRWVAVVWRMVYGDTRGQPDDTRTAAQKTTMRQLLEDLHKRYPRALIVGHRDLSHDRDCPCFDAVKAYADLQPK